MLSSLHLPCDVCAVPAELSTQAEDLACCLVILGGYLPAHMPPTPHVHALDPLLCTGSLFPSSHIWIMVFLPACLGPRQFLSV